MREVNAEAVDSKFEENKSNESRNDERKDTRRNRNRNNRRDDRNNERNRVEEVVEDVNVQEVAALAEMPSENQAEQNGNKRRRNNSRNERNRHQPAENRVEDVNVQADGEQAQVEADDNARSEEGVKNNGRQGRDCNNRQRNNRQRNNRNDRRSNSKKRNIPSSAKIEQYLNITDTADKVLFAVAHVLGLNETVEAANATLSSESDQAEPLVIVVSEPEVTSAEPFVFAIESEDEPAVAQTEGADAEQALLASAVSNVKEAIAAVLSPNATATVASVEAPAETVVTQTEAVAEAAPVAIVVPESLGDLIFVETDPQAVAAFAAQPQPEPVAKTRRSDVPKVEVEDTAVEMILVETRKD